MTARALFRFTGPDKSQLACIAREDSWTVQSHADFLEAHGGDTTASFLWDNLPYVPKPMANYPELEAALEKIREYLEAEWPVREKTLVCLPPHILMIQRPLHDCRGSETAYAACVSSEPRQSWSGCTC